MNRLDVSVAVIGAGSAGMRAYREASKVVDSVVLIEGERYGTTCARVGCMPSKLLIAAADAAEHGRHTEALGIRYGEPEIDGKAVMKRVRDERDRFVGYVVDTVEAWPENHRLMGRARFLDDHTLAVGDDTEVHAERVVIATGSRTNVIAPLKEFGDRLITSDDVFDLPELPDSVAVFGAGVIGLELGQALHRLGVDTVLFGAGDFVGPLTDPEVLSTARALFQAEFEFHPDADVIHRSELVDGVEIKYRHAGETRVRRFDYALGATGRRPNIDDLGLENTSLELDERGMPVFDLSTGRCGESHVFIAGDANSRFPLLHEAADEGMVAGYNAARYPDIRRFRKSAPISVVFSDPQIMMVGRTHAELTASDADWAAAELDWESQGRARVMQLNAGLIRVYGDRNSGRFLGAEMIGPRAEHLAHLLAWAYQSQLTISEMLERPFYHPVFEEGLRTALRNLNYELQMGERPPARCIDCGPGA
jgi:dihydrolipoamide dehydrogenase